MVHQVPSEMSNLVEHLYEGYQVSVAMNTYITQPNAAERSVLQGGCLSPLLFNFIVHTLINTMKADKAPYLGYTRLCLAIPRHFLLH